MPLSTRRALGSLGYELVDGQTPDESPDLRIVDECELDEVPLPEADPDTPIVLLSKIGAGKKEQRANDPRIIGRLARPAPLTPLYDLLQRVLEDTPRRVPRIPTRLPARWIISERQSVGAILSLSEQGCLLRTPEKQIDLGIILQLQFALPRSGVLSLVAESVHRSGPDIGLCFENPSKVAHRAISSFVSHTLMAGATISA